MYWIAEPKHGDHLDARDTMYPTTMKVLTDEGMHSMREDTSTIYGVVVRGVARVDAPGYGHDLNASSYFSFPGVADITLGVDSKVVTIERLGFRGQHAFGLLEGRGRLSYVDGCSDSILVYPPRKGDSVLNHLHFPGDILQVQHTHPSIRMGIVMDGEGVSWRGEHGSKDDLRPFMELARDLGLGYAVAYYEAWQGALQLREDTGHNKDITEVIFRTGESEYTMTYPDEERHASWFSGVDMLYHLRKGGVFMLEEGELHSFATAPGQNMEIVAFHPDSDWGPTDLDHPMLNRTFINHGQ